MLEVLPLVRPFLPSRLRWRIVDSLVEGPAPFGQPAQVSDATGGGWWVAEFTGMQAGTDAHHRTMRALRARLRGGRPIRVPVLDRNLAGPGSSNGFSDGTTFSDGTGFVSGSGLPVSLAEPVALRADTAVFQMGSRQLVGGDWFSLIRPSGFEELHLATWVEYQGDGRWAVEAAPHFRAQHSAGTALNLDDPGCTMRLDDPDGEMWPSADRSWISRSNARFVEIFG